MKRFLSFALVLSRCASIAIAATLRIQIPASNILPNPNVLPASTHATLTSGAGPQLKALLRKGNFLEFSDITTTGSHLLDIYSHNFVFAPYRIDVSSSSQITGAYETYRGTQWSDHGISFVATPTENLTITAKVLSQRSFYEQHPGFDLLGLLKNPMVLMGIVGLGLAFGMPKMMENMDPEMKAEYEAMQKKGPMGGVARALQGGGSGGGSGVENFDLAGFLAGSQARSSAASSGGGAASSANEIRERKR